MIRTVILGLVLGLTLGVSLAAELFDRIGMQPETYTLLLAGYVITALIVNRSVGLLAAFVVLTLVVLQPEQVLLEHGFDKDLLMTALLSTLMYPVVHRVMQA